MRSSAPSKAPTSGKSPSSSDFAGGSDGERRSLSRSGTARGIGHEPPLLETHGVADGPGARAAITIAEPDWQAGYRLLDYELKDASAQPQQGPRVVVVLNLQDRAGKKVNKEVAYEVILEDKVRIGRDAFHQ
jgi:hypothetical protein